MSLARLVLSKSTLAGLRVVFRDEATGCLVEGSIQKYDEDQDCFILKNDSSALRYAVQFHKFTVEEEQRQLVLKVSNCTHMALPSSCTSTTPHPGIAAEGRNGIEGDFTLQATGGQDEQTSDCSTLDAACTQLSAQLSAELSQQLSGLVGQSFSHIEEGFETLVVAESVPLQIQTTVAEVAANMSDAEGDEEDDGLYWGSPVKHDSAAAEAAVAAITAAADVKHDVHEQPQRTNSCAAGSQHEGGSTLQPAPEGTLLAAAEAAAVEEAVAAASPDVDSPAALAAGPAHVPNDDEAADSVAYEAASLCRRVSRLSSSSSAGYDMQHAMEAALRTASIAVPAASSADASFTSFKQISRMISSHEDAAGSPIVGRSNSKSGHGIAGRLLESGGTWGTPREESLWGTPREHHSEQQQHSAADHGSPKERTARLASGNWRGSDASSTGMPFHAVCGETHPHQQQQQENSSSRTESASMAADLAAGAPSSLDNIDFTIAAAVDVQPLPAARAPRRSSRELYRIPSSDATDAGMMVDIPQPLSSRRVSRTSMRAVQVPSDPGFPYGQQGTNSSSGGSAAIAAADLRRVTSMGVSARRVSRSTSSRLNADQDWGIVAPDGQLPPQMMGSGGGAVLHVPAATSRRTSRTLSGRLPLDQDGAIAAVQLTQLGEAEPDVLSRPLTATSMALDTILSRGQSTNGRPGTPDSDGFGFSEFEGIEPLVPPELAQQDAIAEEAVIQAAADEQAAMASVAGHHRHQRRSARNISTVAAAPMHRASMRSSDQDDHGPSPLLSHMGYEASSGTAGRQMERNLSSGQLADQAIQAAAAAAAAAAAVSSSVVAQQEAAAAAGGPGQASKNSSRNSSGLEAVTEDSPPAAECASEDTAAAEPTSTNGSRQNCKSRSRSMSGILQAAAAVAAAAEGAVAAAVGFALGGKGTVDEQQSLHGVAAGCNETGDTQQYQAEARVVQADPADHTSRLVSFADLGAFAAGAAELKDKVLPELKDKVLPDGHMIQPVDSFSCPPFIPMHGGSASAKSNLNPFATADAGSFTFLNGQLQTSSSSNMAAFQIGTAVAADSADALQQQQFNGAIPSPGSSAAGASALLKKQLLPPASVDGSEWGSGAILGSQLNSNVESPIGSAVFKSNPFDVSSDLGSLPAGELTAALNGLSTGKAALGASRMGREAATAANVLPFDGWNAVGPTGVSIHEITPADSDTESEKIGSYRGMEAAESHQQSKLAVGNTDIVDGSNTEARGQLELGFNEQQQHSLGFGEQQQRHGLGFGEPTQDANVLSAIRTLGSAAAQVAAAAAGAPVDDGKVGVSSSSGDGSVLPLPPTYLESVGGVDADDECSTGTPDYLASRRVWPSHYAAGLTAAAAAAAEASSSDSGGSTAGLVRHEAELAAGVSRRVSNADECTTTAVNAGSSTGLVRRSRPVSRAPSQKLPADIGTDGVVFSVDGMVALPGTSYNYEDDDHQPLVQRFHGMKGYAAGQVPSTITEARAQIGRVVLHTCLGTSAQWFDLIALVILGGQLTAAMMAPELSQHQQLERLFVIFAAGHVLWLLGCFMWPWMTSHVGRKAVLAWTVGLSVFPTALLGCMPTYSEGAAAGIVVVAILRFFAGLSLGNEAPAAMTYLAEHAPQLPCLHASLVPCSMTAGALGAAVAALFLSWVLSPAALGAFGWRLTLVATLIANGISAGLRGYVLQDPEAHMSVAEVADRRNGHIWRVLRYHPLQILIALALQAFGVCGLYLMAAWLPVYFLQLTGLKASLGMTIHTINMAVMAGTIPLGGFLADKYGRTSMLLATCAAAALFAYPAWLLFSLAEPGVSWFGQFVLVTFVGLHWGALSAVLVDLFPKGVRSSAMTLSFVLAMVLLGCLSPLIALGFIKQTHSLSSPAILMIISAVVTGGTALVTGRLTGDA